MAREISESIYVSHMTPFQHIEVERNRKKYVTDKSYKIQAV